MSNRKEMLEGFVAQDPADSFSRYALALELEKAGQVAESVVQLHEVTVRDPNYVAAFYHLGRLLVGLGRVDEARDVYRSGLALATKSGDQRTRSEIQEALDALD